MKMTKPGIHVLQGLAMQPLTDLSETPQLSEDERWMEVARIAFPKQRNEQEVIAEQQRVIERFQGSRSERYVYLSKTCLAQFPIASTSGFPLAADLPRLA